MCIHPATETAVLLTSGLEFDDPTHIYRIDGRPVPSVTEITGMITTKYAERTPSIMAAAARGTAIHDITMRMDWNGGEVQDPENDITPETAPYIEAYKKFLQDYRPEWEYIEIPIGSRIFKYAGTVDRVGYIDGQRVIVDLKTTSNLDRVSKATLAMQLAGYHRLVNDAFHGYYDEPADTAYATLSDSFGLQLLSDGNYKIFTVEYIEQMYGFSSVTCFERLLNTLRETVYDQKPARRR